MTPLDWDDVRLFLEILRTGSLTQAAEALGLSQPTLGRRLRRFEAVLGGPVFERLPNRLVPTRLGLELQAGAAAMLEGAAAIGRQAQRHAASGLQPVRITATTSIAMFLAGHAGDLVEAARRHGAELTLEASRRAANLAQREAEIALRMGRLPAEGALAASRIARVAVALYGARSYWDSGPAPVEVIGLPASTHGPSQTSWVDAEAAARGADIRLRLSELPLRHAAVQAGVGISLLPCFLGDVDPALVRIGEPPSALAEDLYLMMHQDLRDTAAVRAVADMLRALFRAHGPLLEGAGPA